MEQQDSEAQTEQAAQIPAEAAEAELLAAAAEAEQMPQLALEQQQQAVQGDAVMMPMHPEAQAERLAAVLPGRHQALLIFL